MICVQAFSERTHKNCSRAPTLYRQVQHKGNVTAQLGLLHRLFQHQMVEIWCFSRVCCIQVVTSYMLLEILDCSTEGVYRCYINFRETN